MMDHCFTTATDMVASAKYEYNEYVKNGGTDPFNVFFGRYRRQHSFRPGQNTEATQKEALASYGLQVDTEGVIDPLAPLPDLDDMEPNFAELEAIEAEEKAEKNIDIPVHLPLFDPTGEVPIPAQKPNGFPKLTGLEQPVKRGRGRPAGSKNKPKDAGTVTKPARVTKLNLIKSWLASNQTASVELAYIEFSGIPKNTVTVYYYRAKKELDIA